MVNRQQQFMHIRILSPMKLFARNVGQWFLIGALFAFGMGFSLYGQSDRGTITGTVADQSGAVVPGARVTVTEIATGIVSKVASNSDGDYTVPQLPPGNYRITVEKEGFTTAVADELPLLIGHTVRADFTLKVGSATQTVQVTATSPVLQTSGPQLATTMSGKDVRELPLAMQGESRSPVEFIRLAPGVTGAQTGMNGLHNNMGKTFATSINGGQTFSYEIQIDGTSIQDTNVSGDMRNLAFPQEAISEFKLVTNNFSAEYGRTGGGIIITTVRSGTNQYHGSAFEYLRNNVLDARGHFTPTTPVLRMNEFGGEFGGPIKKDKAFFFGYYDGFRYRAGSTNQLITLPTLKQRNGDFTDFRDNQGNLIPIYDPTTTQPDGAGGFTRTQFSCGGVLNVICPGQFSTVATNVIKYIPDPTNSGIVNNYLSSGGSGTAEDRWGVKLNYLFNQNNRISGFFAWKRFDGTDPASVSPISGPLSTGVTTVFPERILRINYDWIISPNMVNHVGLGWNHSTENNNRDNLNQIWADTIGLKGVEPVPGMPRFQFTSAAGSFISSNIYNQLGTNGGSDTNAEYGIVITDNLTWSKGHHTFKFGTDIRKNGENMAFQGGGAGQFSFSSAETSLPDSPNRGLTGNPFASFLIGYVDNGFVLVNPATYGNRYAYYSWFAQDDYKVTPKLTLNYGLRYEIPIPRGEAFDRMSTFDPNTPNPGAGNIPGALIYAGFGPGKINKSRFLSADKTEWGPRFGLAYRLRNNTVFRGGYGIYYTAGAALLDNGARTQSFLGYYAQPTFATTDVGVTPAFLLDNGFPQNFIRPPNLIPQFANGSNVDWINYPGVNRAPYVQNWNVAIQQRFGNNISLQVAYVGSKGTRLDSRLTNPNQLNPKWLVLGGELNQPITCLTAASCPQAIAAGVQLPYSGFSGSVAQALRPFPQYNTVFNDFENIGNSTYHSLQVTFEKRFSHNFDFLAAYTFSKSIDSAGSQLAAFFATGAQDQFNRRAEKAVSDNYIPQSLVFHYTYDLPFGPGERYGAKEGVVGKLIGGWEVAGIHEYQSGGIVNSAFGGNLQVANTLPLFTYELRPNVVPGQPRKASWSGKFDPATDLFLNPNAFSIPPPYSFGDAARNYADMRGFAYLNEDVSIIKRTYFGEHRNLEFRADFFNLFNRTWYAPWTVGNNPSNPASYGRVSGQGNTPREIQFALRLNF